jgi:acetyl-CoA C-acetyltransferase
MTTFDPWRTPVVIAAGQASERSAIVTPLDLAERAAAIALADTRGVSSRIDRVEVVGILAGGGRAPARELSSRLGLSPARTATTTVGGNTPQWLVGLAADDISSGRADAVLIAGAEALRSRGLLTERRSEEGRVTSGGKGESDADPVFGDTRPGLAPQEISAGMLLPAHVYPLFESVLAHRARRDFDAHRSYLGQLMSPFTAVASRTPHAWFSEKLDPEAISTPAPDNRVTAEPYTKRMNAFLSVDQGAALLVTSLGLAGDHGLGDRAVFIWSCADAADVWFPTQRPDLGSSPAVAAAARSVLGAAGVGADDVSMFDLYSCFPSAVEFGASAIGIETGDPRGLTVTGGLPYFGGPGNNYSTHAIASIVSSLRESTTGSLGLISALGWYITKHSLGLYGSSPSPQGYRRGDTAMAQIEIDASAVPFADSADGIATVVASTVVYDRDGSPSGAPVIAELADGSRVAARAADHELPYLIGRNLVGSRVSVKGSPPVYELLGEPGGKQSAT